LTRHELKEQLQHDAFKDNVDVAIDFVAVHRRQVVRWVVVAVVIALAVGLAYGIFQYQKNKKQEALQAALDISGAPVMPKPDGLGTTFTSDQAKNAAAAKELGHVAVEYGGSEQGVIAQYYLAGLQASDSKYAEAERNFKAAAATNTQTSALAKVGLAELYAAEGRTGEAQTILEKLMVNPNGLVSKQQATILLASVVKDKDPARAKRLLDSLKGLNERPAVSRGVEQVSQDAQ
jgi:predicted negative regulator of RcsB-dependent stress response